MDKHGTHRPSDRFGAKIWAVVLSRNKEFFRDRGSMAWSFLFPFLIIAGFAFAYSGKPRPQYTVGVLGTTAGFDKTKSGIFAWDYVQFVPTQDEKQAVELVKRHRTDLLIDLRDLGPSVQGRSYWVNSTSPKGYVLEKMLGSLSGESWHKLPVEGAEIRYVDWLLPGVLGLNMMFSALFGVGYVIVRYRKNGVLKRLKATPLTAFQFLTAQVLSRLSIICLTTMVIFIGCVYLLSVPVRGSFLNLFIVYALGAYCLISMGVLVASRVRSEELAGGLLNLVTWPMMFFSGIWFSLEGLNPVIQKIALIFPLTHMISAARSIMIDGASLSSQASHLLVLFIVGLVCLSLGAVFFRWE